MGNDAFVVQLVILWLALGEVELCVKVSMHYLVSPIISPTEGIICQAVSTNGTL